MEETKGTYKWLALLTLSIGTFMSTLDASIVNISLPELTEVFDTEPSVVLWVTVAYLLVSVGLMLSIGKLGDLFGRKRVYVSGMAIFTVGLILCALSQSVVQLILARVVQAVGSAMVIALGNAIITAVFPPEERGKALGLIGAVVSTGLLSGPVIGGLLLDALDWRAIFYVRIPVGIIGLVMSWLWLREQKAEETTARFDWGGSVSLFGGLSCLLLCINFGGRMGFTSIPVLSLAAGAAILLTSFLVFERKVTQPILALGLFRSRSFATGLATMLIMFVAGAANTLLMPFYLLNGIDRTASQAGLLLAATSASSLLVGPVSGWLSDKIGSRILCTVGMTLISAALFLMGTLNINSGTSDILLRLVILGMGLGMFSSPNNSAVMGSVPQQNLSTASAMIATTRQIGMSCGIAIAGAMFTARELFHSTALAGESLAPGMLERLSLVSAYQDSFTYAAFFCIIGIFVSLVRGSSPSPSPSAPGTR